MATQAPFVSSHTVVPAPKAIAKAPKEKKVEVVKKARVAFPGLANGPLTAAPEGYNTSIHKQLNRVSFADEATFWNWRADCFQKHADDCRAKATDAKVLGGGQARKAKQKLDRAVQTLLELQKTSGMEGLDVAALLKAAAESAAK